MFRNLFIFIFKVQAQTFMFFSMSKWSKGFLDLGFQGAHKQNFLIPIFF
jgi:hypothetical protein